MTQIRRSNERGHANHGWLESYHSFSFASYYEPDWMGYRSLRVINDDIVMPGKGFGTHPHQDMEIITYVLSGQLEHKDSMGNGRVIKPGDFQYMAAGTGILHSEFNPSDDEAVHLLQIWIQPDKSGVTPRYAERQMADAETGLWHLAASKDGRDDSMAIHQDADLSLARLEKDQKIGYSLGSDRHAWLHLAEGSIELNGKVLEAGDAAYLSGEERLQIKATTNAQVLLFDLA
ncbi:pirin family protein [Pelagicoccus sp. SDUM812002]|uniref:pirin family protein n=1 Tax=Pelagicoccus sp. SDUM812002 TaxID=3041266 RepID=UPI00280DDA1B|nr:pirin family protein [Pelagicoccus sp. SDUM812002]MDQ8188122.1 pirin family protein [Pelagicoccus sp. SDUM812002]